MADEQTPETEAAAWWGIAQNPIFPQPHRLGAALKALEFYGGYHERMKAAADRMLESMQRIQGQEIIGGWVDEAAHFVETGEPQPATLSTPKRLDDAEEKD